jgi:transketolase
MNKNEKALNYLKTLTAETITNAGTGNLGMSLGASSILFALFKDHYNFDVSDADFLNRDRLVLSAGHASALYYSIMSMFGFDISLQDLKNYGKIGSKTPTYAEYHTTEGVEFSTGASGQGVATAVGMAIAEAVMEERFNTVGFDIINNHTYCLVSDGDIMEGVTMEAVSLAGNLRLNKLILLYDSNNVTLDGSASLTNQENVAKKFLAMGWNVITVPRGNSYFFCTHAIARAKKNTKPTLIIFKTKIGISSQKEGTSAAHSEILTKEELERFKSALKVKESFFIPSDVRELCMTSTRRGKLNHETWNQNLAIYSSTHPELYKSFTAFFDRKKISFERIVKNIAKYDGLSLAKINHYALAELAYQCPQLLGGTADVSATTFASIDNAGNFSSGYRRGKNIKFGVREHSMSAICNGIALYEDFITFDTSYLSFANYQLPAIRSRAAMKLPAMSFFTHDSIRAGDCGSAFQPIEQLGQLRSILGNFVYRPCDYKELVAGYYQCVKNYLPVSLVLSKQNILHIDGTSFEGALQGGYVIDSQSQNPEIVLVSSGADVEVAIQVAGELRKKYHVNVVSMPSIEIFEQQPAAYKNKVISKDAALVLGIEATNDTKWLKVLGGHGAFYGISSYLPSGNGDDMLEKAGFNAKTIAKFVESKLKDKNR